jgi:hypothetical protein
MGEQKMKESKTKTLAKTALALCATLLCSCGANSADEAAKGITKLGFVTPQGETVRCSSTLEFTTYSETQPSYALGTVEDVNAGKLSEVAPKFKWETKRESPSLYMSFKDYGWTEGSVHCALIRFSLRITPEISGTPSGATYGYDESLAINFSDNGTINLTKAPKTGRKTYAIGSTPEWRVYEMSYAETEMTPGWGGWDAGFQNGSLVIDKISWMPSIYNADGSAYKGTYSANVKSFGIKDVTVVVENRK